MHNKKKKKKFCLIKTADSPDDVIDADNAVRPRRPRIMDDGGITLDPNPTAIFGQKSIVLCARLSFAQY